MAHPPVTLNPKRALGLLFDAELLCTWQRWVSTYALAVLAVEELGEASGVSDGNRVVLPTLRELDRARLCAAWLRYSSSALIVGGATVALTFLLAGTVVQEQVFVVLESLYGTLVILGAVLWRLAKPKPYRSDALQDYIVFIIFTVYFALAVSAGTSAARWPVKPYTSPWWQLFAVALAATFLGAIKRMHAESRLESIADFTKKLEQIVTVRSH